jgi:hypothetical protein
MKLGKRPRWILVFAILITSLAVFLTQVDSVQATLSDVHFATVLIRVENEIIRKTPAGQYYDSLLWKHADEVSQIVSAHPEHEEVLLHAIRLFIPGLEALLDGKGDTIHITSEHVKNMEAELDWFAARGSPALQEDIQREQKRFPLDNFVGMTMSEALDFVNSSWRPDMMIQQTSTPNQVVEQALVPDVVVQPDPTPESVVKQTLVAGSNGKWAYYVHDGVYFEYPTGYYLQNSEPAGHFDFMLSTSAPEESDPYEIMVRIWKVPYDQKNDLTPERWYPAESIIWKRNIQNLDFEGLEFISRGPSTQGVDLNAVQYNWKNQIAVYVLCMYIDKVPLLPASLDDLSTVNQRYKYFQHMVDSLRMQTP